MTVVFIAISLGFVALERLMPWRKSQPLVRKGLFGDIVFIAFNAYLFSRFFYSPIAGEVKIQFSSLMNLLGWWDELNLGIMTGKPLWAQFVSLFVIQDFLKWCIHNILHRVPFLWNFHKVHHSVEIMDWLGNMRFHWFEIIVYNSLLFVPLSLLGFAPKLFFWIGVIEIIMGHFNHSNIRINIGWLRYLLNSPRMHIWHHAADEPEAINRNFGIVFSVWDWLLGTAYMPEGRAPDRLGFDGIQTYPSGFFKQYTFPLSLLFRKSIPAEASV